MLLANGYFDWAIRRPGPAWKQNGGVNPFDMFIAHSAVGYAGGFWGVMDGPLHRSVQLFNDYDGKLWQLYPLTAQCWASGSGVPNNRGFAMECEGGYSPHNEPLREAQIATVVRVLEDVADFKGRTYDMWLGPVDANDKNATLYEHNQCRRFGSEPTACPSNRYPWDEIQRRLNPVHAPIPVGIGIHRKDGSKSEIWNNHNFEAPIDGVGMLMSDGSEKTLWKPGD